MSPHEIWPYIAKLSFNFNFNLVESWVSIIFNIKDRPPDRNSSENSLLEAKIWNPSLPNLYKLNNYICNQFKFYETNSDKTIL